MVNAIKQMGAQLVKMAYVYAVNYLQPQMLQDKIPDYLKEYLVLAAQPSPALVKRFLALNTVLYLALRKSKAFTKHSGAYGIIKVNINYSNYTYSLTNLSGQIVSWVSGGWDKAQKKRTRMRGRAIGNAFYSFLKQQSHQRSRYKFIKLQFIGLSKRYHTKFMSILRSQLYRLQARLVCVEHTVRQSFNGCRLSRRKR